MTTALPRFLVIQPRSGDTYVYRNDKGNVANGEESVFSQLVKMEVEAAKSSSKYVHLLVSESNKYWQKDPNSNSIIAVSNTTEEDTSKPNCTLFEPHMGTNNTVSFIHVQTGWRVDEAGTGLVVGKDSSTSYLAKYVDWDTLVKLPEHVAFKGDLGRYLWELYDDHNYLQFSSQDPNVAKSRYRVYLMRDGHVRIKSDNSGNFWRRSPNWIWADSSDVTANNKDTLFWPVKIDDKTIALKNAGNNNFCKRLNADGMDDCLNAAVSTITKEARIEVKELVAERKIYNIRYRMEDARIFGETPYLAGTASVTNDSDEEGSISVAITYENQKSYSFNRSVSVMTGVTNTIEAGVPEIGSESISITFSITAELDWGTTTTTSTSVTATGSVPVPPRSIASVSYVGTRGTCDVPFSYVQQDRSSIDGKVTETDQIDGVYTGINCYNFNFVVEKTQPIG